MSKATLNIQWKKGVHEGMLAWAQDLLVIMITGDEYMTSMVLENMSSVDEPFSVHYFRFNIAVPLGYGGMSDNSFEDAMFLEQLGQQLVEKEKSQLNEVINLLLNNHEA